MTTGPVGLVLVSHSAALAAGLRDLVAQMAPGVPIVAAGGTGAGSELGTSPDVVADALAEADSGAGTVVLYDLGSARMSAELAGEFVDPELAARVRIVDAAFVEGALAAGAAAAGGQSLSEVAAAAAGGPAGERPAGEVGPAGDAGSGEGAVPAGADPPAGDTGGPAADPGTGAGEVADTVVLVDPAGLHARPAAAVVRAAGGLSAWARLSVPGGAVAPAGSLTALLRLAAPAGTAVTVTASGADAATAVRRIVAELAATGDADGAAGTAGLSAAAPGRAVGPLHRAVPVEPAVPEETSAGAAVERDRLDAALRQVRDELAGGGIVAAHRALLDDPELTGAAYRLVAAGRSAPAAWWRAVGEVRGQLAAVDDPVIASRAVDVADVGHRVLGVLTDQPVELSAPAGSVLLADDVPPSQVASLVAAGTAGFVLRAGAARSHAAVLARAAGVPMVVAVGTALDMVAEGTPVLVDGGAGTVTPDPPPVEVTRPAAVPEPAGPVYRPGGGLLAVAANVASVADARVARDAGADGVGLLRTELLFTGRGRLPGEDEQVAWLSGILAECPPGPVVVRTVDLGGDKPVPALRLDPVRHGFLGARGLRLCLAEADLFGTHLRAVLRAAVVRPVDLMFPFVTDPAEVVAARSALAAAAASLAADGVPYAVPARVGMMVEIPTAAVAVEPFLPLVDFLSVGSNDLAQYLAAADRTLGAVAAAYRAGERAVPDLVARLVAAAAPAGVPVAVCGDIAGDPVYARALLAAGVDELSVAPPLVRRVRAELADG